MTSTAQPARGTYLLLARLDEPVELSVGQLGTFAFPAGWYAYAGSALGPGGLPARLARHARLVKRLHWHIDYLLHKAILKASWQIASPDRLECAWASATSQLPGARIAVPRFGASDCRCRGHLVYLAHHPADSTILHALCQASSDAGRRRISRRVYANCTVR
jgi:Uri superfamily endonuclease